MLVRLALAVNNWWAIVAPWCSVVEWSVKGKELFRIQVRNDWKTQKMLKVLT